MKTLSFRKSVLHAACGLLLASACGIPTVRAALLDADSFAYSGTALSGQNGGTGWNGAWFTTATSPNSLSDDGVSLSYPPSYESPIVAPPVSGSRIQTGSPTGNASTSRLLSQTIPLNVDGTVRYVSALFQKNRPNGEVTTDNILLEFVDASANRRWGIGIEGTTDKPWLNANASTTPSTGPAVTAGETYLIVAKIVSASTGVDTAFLKVFGVGYGSIVPADEPTTWDATQTQTTGAILDRIRVRIDTGNTTGAPGVIDQIRIADTWQDVVAVPEPSSIALAGLALIGGVVASRRRLRR